MSFNPTDATTIKDLNERLTKQSYVAGYTPSMVDEKCLQLLFGDNTKVLQWAARMASYYPQERAKMPPSARDDDSADVISERSGMSEL